MQGRCTILCGVTLMQCYFRSHDACVCMCVCVVFVASNSSHDRYVVCRFQLSNSNLNVSRTVLNINSLQFFLFR